VPRVRFAPSPTGELHVGNARTALFNWLFARRYGGRFIVRIEDTDQERTTKYYEQALLKDLRWLLLDWDEGPERGGEFGPYHQIERLRIYESFLHKLLADGRVYPCYCSEEELEAERTSLLSMKMMPRYMGKCRHLSNEERKKRQNEGRKPAFRFNVERGLIAFDDLVRGAMKFEGDAIGDFIIMRSNGIPAYNFAVVIDDHLMDITHVIRGEDHLSNTAMQILLYKALGFIPPLFAHHSLILGRDRTKLSKRHGAISIREFRDKGFLPEALLNYLALLGSSLDGGKEIASLNEITDMFSLEKAGKSGAVFDEDKLKWINGIYIRNHTIDSLTERLVPFISDRGYDIDTLDRSWLCRVVDAVRGNLATLADIGENLEMFIDDRYSVSDEADALIRQHNAKKVICALRDILQQEDAVGENLYSDVVRMLHEKTGMKGKALLMPVRAAITGRTSGVELDKIFSILGKESIRKRLEKTS
jgi:nondiscriminating glutamyl-tRNA synthetase